MVLEERTLLMPAPIKSRKAQFESNVFLWQEKSNLFCLSVLFRSSSLFPKKRRLKSDRNAALGERRGSAFDKHVLLSKAVSMLNLYTKLILSSDSEGSGPFRASQSLKLELRLPNAIRRFRQKIFWRLPEGIRSRRSIETGVNQLTAPEFDLVTRLQLLDGPLYIRFHPFIFSWRLQWKRLFP